MALLQPGACAAARARRSSCSPARSRRSPARLDSGAEPRTSSSGSAPGDIAIIDHADLDRIAAEDLVASGVAAVVNVAQSSTGRYPNPGPLVLARAGVTLIDVPGGPALRGARRRRPDGDRGRRGCARTGRVLATGRVIDLDDRHRPDRAPARAHQRGARRLRDQHDRTRARGGRAAGRPDRPPAGAHRLPRPPRADRRSRHDLPPRPAHPARLHRGHPPGARRRRRRRRRDPRGGL